MPVSKREVSPCPMDAALSVIDGRWKGTILWHLSRGAMRTSELRRNIPEITQRMLIRHLPELVGDGILIRVEDETVRSTYYRISEYGERYFPCSRASVREDAFTCNGNLRRVSRRPSSMSHC